ncbi:MAG TPA: hypothetical protein VF905_07380 [Nitrospirota bacterium]
MVTSATIKRNEFGWNVYVDYGISITAFGPYRWRWLAFLVAWLEDGQH